MRRKEQHAHTGLNFPRLLVRLFEVDAVVSVLACIAARFVVTEVYDSEIGTPRVLFTLAAIANIVLATMDLYLRKRFAKEATRRMSWNREWHLYVVTLVTAGSLGLLPVGVLVALIRRGKMGDLSRTVKAVLTFTTAGVGLVHLITLAALTVYHNRRRRQDRVERRAALLERDREAGGGILPTFAEPETPLFQLVQEPPYKKHEASRVIRSAEKPQGHEPPHPPPPRPNTRGGGGGGHIKQR